MLNLVSKRQICCIIAYTQGVAELDMFKYICATPPTMILPYNVRSISLK
jgi:hypothetical protein